MANPHPLPSPATQIAIGENLCDPEDKLSPLAQIKRMQRVLYKFIQADEIGPKEASTCALAWERLEGRKAILTMRPAPKPVDVQPKGKRKGSSLGAQPAD